MNGKIERICKESYYYHFIHNKGGNFEIKTLLSYTFLSLGIFEPESGIPSRE